MKEMKNIDELLRQSMEGHNPSPPPRVKRRVLATIIATFGFTGGSTLFAAGTLVVVGTLVAGITASVLIINHTTQAEDAYTTTYQPSDLNHLTNEYSDSNETLATTKGPLEETDKTGEFGVQAAAFNNSESVRTEALATKDARNAETAFDSAQKTNKLHPKKSAGTTVSDQKSNKTKSQKRESTSRWSADGSPGEKSSSTGPVNERIAGKGLNFGSGDGIHGLPLLMASLSPTEIPMLRTSMTLKDPEDFYMPNSPRQHSRWSLQTQWVGGHTAGLLRHDEISMNYEEPDPVNTTGIRGLVLFHLNPRWALGLGLAQNSLRTKVTSEYDESVQITETVVIDGVETTVVSIVTIPRSEQEALRFSYLSVPLTVQRSFYLNERLSIEANLGTEIWFLNFSRGKYRMAPDRKLDLSIPENARTVLHKTPVFISAGTALNYRIFHRFNVQAGPGILSLIDLNNKSTGFAIPTGYTFHAGFGYRF